MVTWQALPDDQRLRYLFLADRQRERDRVQSALWPSVQAPGADGAAGSPGAAGAAGAAERRAGGRDFVTLTPHFCVFCGAPVRHMHPRHCIECGRATEHEVVAFAVPRLRAEARGGAASEVVDIV